jgi:hypothetical protein
MTAKLDLATFPLKQATIEIRYNNAYQLWDRAGKLWSTVCGLQPSAKVNDAKPSKLTFYIDNKFTLGSELGKSYLFDVKPSTSLKEFTEMADQFLNVVMDVLEISELNRIGFRLQYAKHYDDQSKASNAMLDYGIIKTPTGKYFNIEGDVILPQYAFVWQGKSTALKVNMTVQDKTLDFNPLPNVDGIEPYHSLKHELMIDMDYYTTAPILRGQFKVSEWLTQSYHLIKRDINKFIGA